MPTTGVLNQDEAPVDNSNTQNDSEELLSSVPPTRPSTEGEGSTVPENSTELTETASVVSSTTVDPDASMAEEPQLPMAVESSVATPSDAKEVTSPGETSHETQEIESKDTALDIVSSAPFSQSSTTGFQSAFAAFASASTSHIEADAMEVDESFTHVDSEVVSGVSPEESSPMVEQSVTSAIDSALVTTTQESLVTSGESLEPQQVQPMSYEQENLSPETALESSMSSAITTEVSASELSPVVETAPNTETPSMPESFPVSEESSMPKSLPVTEGSPMLESIPVTEESSISESVPVTEELPMSESFPSNEESPMPESVPGTEESPMPESVSGSKESPMPESVPGTEESPMPESVPGTEESPMPESVPGTEESPMSESVPGTEESSMPESVPGTEESSMPESVPGTEESPMPKVSTVDMQSMGEAPVCEELSESPSEAGVVTQPQTDLSEGQVEGTNITHPESSAAQPPSQPQTEESVTSDAVYFIQMTDTSGEIVTSIIDPNDISSYSDSIVYRQCMGTDGQIETTIVNSGSVPVAQAEQSTTEETQATQPEMEQQVIYAHDLNGHLTPIDSSQSATDVAPPGKQFVYMQDSSGRIIRTIMDANQTMVPGQQVYYTQSEDGRIITSVMDSSGTEDTQPTEESIQQQQQVSQPQQSVTEEQGPPPQAPADAVTATSAFAMDNSMSGLNMLAELSHLTAGQASSERRDPSNNDSNSQDTDMEEFRPVAMITRRVAEDGVEMVKSSMANLKFAQEAQNIGPQESMVAKLVSEIKTEGSGPGDSVSRDNLFVQWQNLDAMCWMDVVLVMLVYSPTLRPLVNLDPSHELASTLLITLLKANRQAQVLLQNLLKNSAAESSLQTGAGNIGAIPDVKSSKLVCKENMDEIGKAINILYAMRERIWQALQPRLRCERGKHNSPVLVLPLLVREKPIIKQMFTMNYRYVFKCARCGYSQDDSHSKILPTIPAVPLDFNMKEPCFVRNCFECQAPAQRMLMKFEGLQDFVQMHFVKGLPHNRFDELSFDHNGDHYEVTGVIHYKNNPDHFIAWVRNAPSNTWMECDDLKSVITRYQTSPPSIPPSQVHMVMWERRLTPEHTLVMRDTEDTKYLASLVLTVQQPASSQTNTETSNLSQKRLGAPLGSAVTAPSVPTGGPASTILSGLMSQSQNLAATQSHTPRARGGRGSRGSRPSRGGVTIRRAAPLASTQMATPRQSSTQIIRLPVSALQSGNSNLRGSTGASPSPRYFLVGGNNAQSTTGSSGTASKVVVLRSQGGSSSINNLSAAQLLQLLQQSGALSQTNTRITTQLKPAGDGSSDSVVTKVVTNTSTSQPEGIATSIEPSTTAIPTQNQSEGEENKNISAPQSQPESTVAPSVPSETAPETATSDIPAGALPASSSALINVTDTPSSTPHPSSSVIESSLSQQGSTSTVAQSGTIRTLSMNPTEPARYIQIPSSSGGGNIVTQLVMKGGKMVLVPVDKNAQTQPTSTPSIIRLPSSALKSSQLNTSSISSPTILQASPGLLNSGQTTSSVSSTLSSPQYITLPSTQGTGGNKRTIQFITVPRGTNSSSGGQTAAKTIIVSPAGSQTSSRVVTDTETGFSSEREVTTQAGNIVIRELKHPDDSSSSSISTNSALSSSMEVASSNVPGNVSTVSLLRDIGLKSVGKPTSEDATSGSGVSLLSSSPTALTSKPQECFKYILPGSSLHQMSAIQNISGPQSGRAFTALSSSGTIIGGHLTPTSGSLSVDQSTSIETDGDGTQTIYTAMKDEIILRGRGRGRGQRGRGRGVRTRGRGRQQMSETVAVASHPQSKIIKRGGTISMLSADLRQVGGQIIESTSEDVDGVPVVSIPDFSGVGSLQTESLSAAESLTDSINQTTCGPSDNMSPSLQQNDATNTSDPLVITQTIPSIKGNHGFDILTQGILGTNSQASSLTPRKSGISLLTGKTVIPSSLSASISLEASKTQQSLAMGQSVTQNEIETLIKAAQGAAKPPIPGQTSAISSKPDSFTNVIDSIGVQAMSGVKSPSQEDFISNNFMTTSAQETSVNPKDCQALSGDTQGEPQVESLTDSLNKDSPYTEAKDEVKDHEEERVVSVDESQVSAAERYRMPTELFQPDDESPEKPVKSDILSRQLSGSQILGEDLPSKLFQDSEMSSQEEDASMSPQRQPKSPTKSSLGSPQTPINKSHDAPDTTLDLESSQVDDSVAASRTEDDMEVNDTEHVGDSDVLSSGTKSPAKRGKRGRGRGRGGKSKGLNARRKSTSTSDAQDSTIDVSSPSHVFMPTSPVTTGQQEVKDEWVQNEDSQKDSSASIAEQGNTNFVPDVSPLTSIREMTSDSDQQNLMQFPHPECQDKKVVSHENFDQDKVTEHMKIKGKSSQKTIMKPTGKYEPVITCTRPKISWDVEQIPYPHSVFNYKVLSRNSQKASHRHPSLGPRQESFTSPPESLPKLYEKIDMRLPMQAIVTRRERKALERPIVDPSKEPTVIPLVAEEDGDPACTGGSVVTSHIDGEVFTGVIVHQRREMADWSCGLEDDEDEDRYRADGMEEDKDEMREYAETMWTAMCMEVGNFNVFYLSDSDSVSDFEEDSMSEDSINNVEESVQDSQEELTEKHFTEATEDHKDQVPYQSPGSKLPHRKRSSTDDSDLISDGSAQSPKRVRISVDESALSPLKEQPDNESAASGNSQKVTTTRVNGISSNQSASNHTDPATLSTVSPLPVTSVRSSDKPESFASPARRSSRTPVPSFKIRDYVEDKPVKSTSKGRRSSVLSSDDDFSGYQSDGVPTKRGKKKSVKTLPAETSLV